MASPNGALAVRDLDLHVFGGEIVCIAGVQGNGQTELAEALLGVTPTMKGSMLLDGNQMAGLSPRKPLMPASGSFPRTANSMAASARLRCRELDLESP